MSTAENTQTPHPKARSLREIKARRMVKKFGILVVLPTFLATVYYGLVASDVYESVSSFTVQTAEVRPTIGLESLMAGMAATATSRDALTVQEFILSRDMLSKLETEHGFSEHYKNKNADFISRMWQDATFEEKFEYYTDRVQINYETLSGVLTMTVKAYDAEKSKVFADAVLQYSEEMVNHLSDRVRQDQINFAKSEVGQAEERMATAQQTVIELQNEGADFHPVQSAESLLSIRTKLEVEVAKARASLSEAQSIMHPNAPKVVSLRKRVLALEKQIERENKRLLGSEKSGLSESIMRFESAMMEKEFAEKQYQSAMASLELAKMEAARQSRYLATIAAPSTPDEATHPQRWLGVLTVFLVSLAVFGIGSLMVAAVREHARI